MNRAANGLKVAYVLKRFPRLSETFILNEILELEARGVEVVIFAYLRPNDGRFHAQIARLKAKVHYMEGLDPRRWHEWLSGEWALLSRHEDRVWEVLRESFERGDSVRAPEIVWGAWLAAQLLKLGVQHIHSHFGTMSSTIAWFASRISGVPFSFTAHAKDIYAYDFSAHRLREKMASASRVVTVTQCNREYLLAQAPEIDPGKVRVLYNGIDLEYFAPNAIVQREPNLVLSVGRLVPKKGFDDLLDACVLLRERGIDFRCLIVGDGPEEAGLIQKRQLLDLEREVELVGPMGQHEVVQLMHRATVLCLPCKEGPDKNRDALPTVLLEALGCGLPVVSTDFSGIPEIVDHGVDGLLVPAGDVAGIAAAVASVFASPELQQRLSQNGRAKALRRFDIHRNVGELLEVFQESATTKPANAARAERRGDRVLVLCVDRGIPFGGTKGASVHLREFAEALQAARFEPTAVMAKRDPGSLYNPTYPVHVLPRQAGSESGNVTSVRETEGFRNQALQQLLVDLHRTNGFDVLYERYSLFGTGGRMVAQKLGIPYVLEVNSPLVEEAAQFRGLEELDLARDVERYVFSTADHITVVSKELERYVLSVAPQARVTVLQNGVNLERFDRAARTESWRARLTDQPDRGLVVGFLGRVRPWHGVELLIDACGELLDCEDLRLCIVGGGEEQRDALERRAHERGLDGRFRYLEGVPPEGAPALLKSMDILVAPYPQLTTFYFSPLKVFEYMASGRPIVASDIGQVSDLLENGKTALLVPAGDVPALARAIRRLRDDAELRARLGTAAHAEVARRHTWAHGIEKLRGIFDSLRASATTAREASYVDTL